METVSNLSMDVKNTMPHILESWRESSLPRFSDYRPNENIFLETANYILKTAVSMDELLNVFRLRYENCLEHVKGEDAEAYDLDRFDHLCDHLIIINKESSEVVGTYRVLCSLYTEEFYSEGEFELKEFLASEGVKIELGRACIDPDFRNGNVIDLLWKGIAEYINLTNASYLFGCSSISTVSTQTALDIYTFMSQKGYCEEAFNIKPTSDFMMSFKGLEASEDKEVKKLIPSLLRSYITAGSKVVGAPALDQDFACIDFLTVLEIEKLSPLFRKRYFR